MSWVSSSLTCGPVALLIVTATGAVQGMAPDVSKLAGRTAEDAGCSVIGIEEKGLRDGFLMFSVTCEAGSSSAMGDVACKDGVCIFQPLMASSGNN